MKEISNQQKNSSRIESLSKEQAFYINVISDYINEKDNSEIPDGINEEAFLELANKGGVAGIAYHQTKIATLKQEALLLTYFSENRRKILEKIGVEFSKENIDHLIFKGAEVAKYYRHPHYRFSCDIDLLVKKEDKKKAGEVLEKIGFSCTETKKDEHEWNYKQGDFTIELHHRLVYDDELNNPVVLKFADRVWEHAILVSGTRYMIEKEYGFVYLLLHIRKHFLYEGMSLRMFADLAIMMRNAKLNFEKANAYIDDCKIREFADIIFALIERWFGVKPSNLKEGEASAKISEEFFVRETKKILSFELEESRRETRTKNEIVNQTKKEGKFRSTLKAFFPSYEQMKSRYPSRLKSGVVGRIQLPYFWIVRFFESTKKKTTKSGLDYALGHITGNKEREEEIKSWGISD